MGRLFGLGVVVATPGALELLAATGTDPTELLRRHHGGDWGDLDAHDWRENERSVRHGWRILSVYLLDRPLADAAREPADPRARLWILTEASREVTTILLPEEY